MKDPGDREDLNHKLQLEVQQLTTPLNTRTQTRLGLSKKFDNRRVVLARNILSH
jgi:hypothetical protein